MNEDCNCIYFADELMIDKKKNLKKGNDQD